MGIKNTSDQLLYSGEGKWVLKGKSVGFVIMVSFHSVVGTVGSLRGSDYLTQQTVEQRGRPASSSWGWRVHLWGHKWFSTVLKANQRVWCLKIADKVFYRVSLFIQKLKALKAVRNRESSCFHKHIHWLWQFYWNWYWFWTKMFLFSLFQLTFCEYNLKDILFQATLAFILSCFYSQDECTRSMYLQYSLF